jgi:hypothetical protein
MRLCAVHEVMTRGKQAKPRKRVHCNKGWGSAALATFCSSEGKNFSFLVKSNFELCRTTDACKVSG